MIIIGIAQIKNSVEIEDNFTAVKKALSLFQETETDLILFPECSLSGFSSKMKNCKLEDIQKYLDEIQEWTRKHSKSVVLPTALHTDKIYNSGFIFTNGECTQFYKTGLTTSEEKFFSRPALSTKKIFRIKNHNIAILICFEAQMDPWSFFGNGDVDIILWPSYWGWEKQDTWQEFKNNGEENEIYRNMQLWKRPLLQSNFAFNDLGDYGASGPHGLSMFINSDNSLREQGGFELEECYRIVIENNEIVFSEKI